MILAVRHFWGLPLLIALLIAALSVAVYAQLEGGERGVAPIDSASNFEVKGIRVDVAGPNADLARMQAWRIAQREGWKMLWAQTHDTPAPNLGDGDLDGIVSGIVVEDEQIGPNRYIARLGVLFDRVRTGERLGVAGNRQRSAPLLVIPIQYSGGVPRSFESRTEWQKAWARFRTSDSDIDYVRPTGSGADPLLLTAGQVGRPGRRWWRMLLDQYGAADVVVPQVRLERIYPGGPVIGHFSAFIGPDAKPVGSFTLMVTSNRSLDQLMDAGVQRLDAMLVGLLRQGKLRPDSSLVLEQTDMADEDQAVADDMQDEASGVPVVATGGPAVQTRVFALQFESPNVASITATEAAVRGAPGVRAASTTSLALGGVSVMRVSFDGDGEGLRAALAARGLRVSLSGDTLRIRR
ncbi:MAG: heavy-metal-associated domain-containing protein [Chakrabartia sp.]